MEHEKKRMQQVNNKKQSIYYALENPLKGGPLAKSFGIALLVLIVISALLVFVTDDPNFSDTTRFSFNVIASASTVFFGVEYFLRLWVADLVYPHLNPGKARLKYVFSLMGIIDFLAFAPGLIAFFLPLSTQLLHSIRIIRLVRLLKLTRYMKGLHSIGRVFGKRRTEIIAAFVVLGLLTITASVLMYTIEGPVQPEKFDSVFTGMYWAMTTITTTGYGDIVPITAAGRLVGFFIMVLAIGVVAIPAGIFSAGFVAEFRSEDVLTKVQDLRQDSPSNESTD